MNCSICNVPMTRLPENLFACPNNHVFLLARDGHPTWEPRVTLVHRLAIRIRDLMDNRPVSDQFPVLDIGD